MQPPKLINRNSFARRRSSLIKQLRKRSSLHNLSQVDVSEKLNALYDFIHDEQVKGRKLSEIKVEMDQRDYVEVVQFILTKENKGKKEFLVMKHLLIKFPNYSKPDKDLDILIGKIINNIKFETIPLQNVVCHTGEIGDKFYFIFKGTVSVLVPQEIEMELTPNEYLIYLEKLIEYQEFHLLGLSLKTNKKLSVPDRINEFFE